MDKNNPTLFINSVDDKKNGMENQEVFDSRNMTRKKLARHRLDDIRAMLYYRLNVLCEVLTYHARYEGIVIDVNEYALTIDIDGKSIEIPLIEVQDINILKL